MKTPETVKYNLPGFTSENAHPGKRSMIKSTINEREIRVPKTLSTLETELLSFISTQPGIYGYQLIQGDSLNNGSLYRLLNKLRKWGYLEMQLEPQAEIPTHYGQARRLYTITEAGLEKLRDSQS